MLDIPLSSFVVVRKDDIISSRGMILIKKFTFDKTGYTNKKSL